MMLKYPIVSNNHVVEDHVEQLTENQAKLYDHLLHAQKWVIVYGYYNVMWRLLGHVTSSISNV